MQNETLQIDSGKAKSLFKQGDRAVQDALKELCGRDIFGYTHFADINSLEDALNVLGETEARSFPKIWMELSTTDEIAYRIIKNFVEANNKVMNWKADYNDPNQKKFFPYWEVRTRLKNMHPSGLGLSLYGVLFVYTGTGVGSRLSVGSPEEMRHIAKVAQKHYEDFLI